MLNSLRIGVGVATLLLTGMVAVVAVGLVTWYWWDDLSRGDTPANVLRTAALIEGGIVALVFALWRAIVAERQADAASQQADAAMQQTGAAMKQADAAMQQTAVARQELNHERFLRAAELLSRQGLETSHARISALHQLRYLSIDAPDLGLEVLDVVFSFMIQVPIDEHHDPREFAVARRTAEAIPEAVSDRLDEKVVQRLREEVAEATRMLAERYKDAGIDPYGPMHGPR